MISSTFKEADQSKVRIADNIWIGNKANKPINVIDESVWRTYANSTVLEGLNFSGAKLERRRVKIVVKTLMSVETEGHPGISVMTLPKGLTISKIREMGQNPVQGSPTRFNLVMNDKLDEFILDKTRIVVITNGLLVNSKTLSADKQQDLMMRELEDADKLKRMIKPFKFRDVLSITALTVLNRASSTEQPPACFYKGGWSFSRCSNVSGYEHVAAGGDEEKGFNIFSNTEAGFQDIGIAVMYEV